MKENKFKYSNEPIGKIKIVKDFLPSPQELASSGNTVKVTLTLNKSNVEYFKKMAEKHHSRYQTMIRTLLDEYVKYHKNYGVND
jgi:predicted DNA binding CopG/RHH family protein